MFKSITIKETDVKAVTCQVEKSLKEVITARVGGRGSQSSSIVGSVSLLGSFKREI